MWAGWASASVSASLTGVCAKPAGTTSVSAAKGNQRSEAERTTEGTEHLIRVISLFCTDLHSTRRSTTGQDVAPKPRPQHIVVRGTWDIAADYG
jgi:hypothetical protein